MNSVELWKSLSSGISEHETLQKRRWGGRYRGFFRQEEVRKGHREPSSARGRIECARGGTQIEEKEGAGVGVMQSGRALGVGRRNPRDRGHSAGWKRPFLPEEEE